MWLIRGGHRSYDTQRRSWWSKICCALLNIMIKQNLYNLVVFVKTLTLVLPIARIEYKPQWLESRDSLLSHVRLASRHEQLKLPSLTFHPNGKLWILGVPRRYIAVFVGLSERTKLVPSLFPQRRMRVPDKPKFLKGLLTLLCHGGVDSIQLQTVLVPLSFHPMTQWWVEYPIQWNQTMVVLCKTF